MISGARSVRSSVSASKARRASRQGPRSAHQAAAEEGINVLNDEEAWDDLEACPSGSAAALLSSSTTGRCRSATRSPEPASSGLSEGFVSRSTSWRSVC